MLNKKRTQAEFNQPKIYERQSEASRKTASKSKQDPNSQPNLAAAQNIEEEKKESDEEEDDGEFFDVQKEIQRLKNEKEFQKEFAKDMRKIDKIKKSNA